MGISIFLDESTTASSADKGLLEGLLILLSVPYGGAFVSFFPYSGCSVKDG